MFGQRFLKIFVLTAGISAWLALNRINTEIIYVVTDQQYKISQSLPRSQDQQLYQLVCSKGVDAAISWFEEKGKKIHGADPLLMLRMSYHDLENSKMK